MSDAVFQETVTVDIENGLHLVPCSRIAQLSGEFECDIFILKGDRRVNARTVLELMTLGAVMGTELVVETQGSDAEDALRQLVRLFQNGFEIVDGQEAG